MSSRSLDDLDPRMKPLSSEVILRCIAAGVPVTIITTLRTAAEQSQAVARGVSWTLHSKHLPQPPSGLSLAIDLCPTELLEEKNWAPADLRWWTVAEIGVSLGLRSGMDWHGVGLPPLGSTRPAWDPGHLEFVG